MPLSIHWNPGSNHCYMLQNKALYSLLISDQFQTRCVSILCMMEELIPLLQILAPAVFGEIWLFNESASIFNDFWPWFLRRILHSVMNTTIAVSVGSIRNLKTFILLNSCGTFKHEFRYVCQGSWSSNLTTCIQFDRKYLKHDSLSLETEHILETSKHKSAFSLSSLITF